ncbi:hypothetical protein B0H14DRAFT_3755564 [Mycena olivaceomarginata]|nr:hypothetical protein B0H14DRAFT_3755564 [Mycena olivaceomarginata]
MAGAQLTGCVTWYHIILFCLLAMDMYINLVPRRSSEFNTRIPGRFWNDSAYEGLRKFHQAKGFDPDIQDLALDKLSALLIGVQRAEDWDADDESNYTQTSIDSDAEASEQDDWDVEDESNYPQTSDDSNAEAYSEEDDNNSDSTDSSTAFSGTFTFLMNDQLALILFLGLSWLYEQIHPEPFRIPDGQCGTTRHLDPIGIVRYGDHRCRANGTPRTLDPHRQSGTHRQSLYTVADINCRGRDIQGTK